jgi:hypothetical protein
MLLAWVALSLPAAIAIGRAIMLAERRSGSGRVRDRGGRRRSAEGVPPLPHPRDEEESA